MLSFITPLWLFAIPIASALLLYAYLRHGRSKQNKISSLFFIQQVAPSIASGRRKISLPWRVLFELLVLLSLIAALAGMLLKNTSERAIIVIDNSLSMGAVLNPSAGKETGLDESKRSASSNLQFLSDIKSASVWITSPVPQQITAGFVSAEEARKKIENISISFSTGNISAVFSRIKDSAKKVLIYSDQLALSKEQSINSEQRLIPLNIDYSNRNNVAIESIALEHSINTAELQLNTKLKSYLNKQAQCRISISGFKKNEWKTLAVRDVTLNGIGQTDLLINLDSADASQSQAAIKAQIVSCTPENSNILSLDDSAWLSTKQDNSSIILISEFTPAQLGLDQISGIKMTQISPQEWNNLEQSKSRNLQDQAALIIFHRNLPKELPEANALFISPPPGSTLLPVNSIEGSARLVRWQNESAILSYLNLPDIDLKGAVVFSTMPAWSSALMYSAKGPVAIFGALSRYRYAAIGFEILPFEGKKNPFLSILALNLLKWLSKNSEIQASGSLLRINVSSAIKNAIFIDSAIKNPSYSISDSKQSLNVDSPGLVGISTENSASIHAINFFSSEESNLKEPGFVNFPKEKAKEEGPKNSGVALELYLLILALAVLVIDSSIFIYKSVASSRSKRAI